MDMALKSTERTFGRRGLTPPSAMSRPSTSGPRGGAVDEQRLDAVYAAHEDPQPIDVKQVQKLTGMAVAAVLAVLVLTGMKQADATLVVSLIVLAMALRPEVEAALRTMGRFGALSAAEPGLSSGERLLFAVAGVGAHSPLLAQPVASRWRIFGATETVGTKLLESLVPRAIGVAFASFVALSPTSFLKFAPASMTADLAILGYAAMVKGAQSTVDFAQSIYRVRKGVRRSPWFAVGALAGALLFIGNDRLDLVPLSPTDAVIKVTVGSQEALVEAIDKSGIIDTIDTTFAFNKNGMTYNRTLPDGTQSDPVKNRADWARTRFVLDYATRIMWFVDLFAIAAACGFALNTLMVRVFGFAGTGQHGLDD